MEINSSVPEDPEMAAIVRKYQDLIGAPCLGLWCARRWFRSCPVGVGLEHACGWEHAARDVASTRASAAVRRPSIMTWPCLAGTKMDEPLGWTHTDLDARFDTVRRSESNIGAG